MAPTAADAMDYAADKDAAKVKIMRAARDRK